MATHVLSLFIKIALFSIVMLIVAKMVPYDELVDSITGLFDFQRASAFTHFILGEPDPDVWESLRGYFSFLINIVISVPVMCACITAYKARTHKLSSAGIVRELANSSLRRFAKIGGFMFLFWALFRLLPYQYIFPVQTYSKYIVAAVLVVHMLLTMSCYSVITKTVTIKSSLVSRLT